MKHKGGMLIGVGSALLLAALSLALYNAAAEYKAKASAEELIVQLAEAREEPVVLPVQDLVYIPDYVLNPAMDMPITKIGADAYIGVLDIPAIAKTLPILDVWTYDGIAPGGYAGTVYQHNIVIAGHNYAAHFGDIGDLLPNDEVIFTDVRGNIFKYRVLGIEILNPDEIERMTTGDWDLTLFTCTYSASQRVTVRCALVEDLPALGLQ